MRFFKSIFSKKKLAIDVNMCHKIIEIHGLSNTISQKFDNFWPINYSKSEFILNSEDIKTNINRAKIIKKRDD